MADNNTPETLVDIDTDDLDAFNDILYGKESPDQTPEPEETVEDEQATPEVDEDIEDDSLADDDSDNDELVKNLVPKKKKTAQERIKEVIARERQVERELEAAKAELERLKATKEPEPTTPAKVEGGPPTADDLLEDGSPKYQLGEFDPKFIADYTKFAVRQETARIQEEQAEAARVQQAQEARNALTADWQARLEEAQQRMPDFNDQTQNLVSAFSGLDPAYGEYLSETIMSLDSGPEILYYLSTHIDEARQIVNAGPRGATIALGRLEARLAVDEPEKQPIKVSNAPTPPPINKGTTAKFETPDDTDDLNAFEKKFFRKR